MKNLTMLLIFILVSCTPKSNTVNPVVRDSAICDSFHTTSEKLFITDTISVSNEIFEHKYDSLLRVVKKKNDSLFLERYKIERIKYYNKIVQKNKTQLKFLSGWINRVVNNK
ncbi:MAG: hypothetical protein H7Y10_03595 [Flavobacterium sp.]|nr:hypothetical protein [Flavobacterium sp.]